MKPTKFETPVHLSFRSINLANALEQSGVFVEVLRQAATHRCIFYADDTSRVRELIQAYESGETLPIPTKQLLETRSDLHQRCRKAQSEAA